MNDSMDDEAVLASPPPPPYLSHADAHVVFLDNVRSATRFFQQNIAALYEEPLSPDEIDDDPDGEGGPLPDPVRTPLSAEVVAIRAQFLRSLQELAAYVRAGGDLQHCFEAIVQLVHVSLTESPTSIASKSTTTTTTTTRTSASGPTAAKSKPLTFATQIDAQHLAVLLELLHASVTSSSLSQPTRHAEASQALTNDFLSRLLVFLACPTLPKVTMPHTNEQIDTRQQVKSIVHRIYGGFVAKREYLVTRFHWMAGRYLTALQASLFAIGRPATFAGLSELLQVIASIAQGLAAPLKTRFNDLFRTAVLQLHQPAGTLFNEHAVLGLFHQALSFCTLSFVQRDPATLAIVTLKHLISSWPNTNSKHAVLLLNEMEEVLELLPAEQMSGRNLRMLLEFLRDQCVSSPNFMVAQRAMLLMNNAKVKQMLVAHSRTVAKMLGRVLLDTAYAHWNDTSRQMAFQILSAMAETEPELTHMPEYREVRTHFEVFEGRERMYEQRKIANMRRKKTGLTFDDFALSRLLGEGSFSRVYLALLINHDGVPQRHWETYAIKEMDLQLLEAQQYVGRAREEARMLDSFDHPNIVTLITTFETKTKFSLVLEYLAGGDVFQVLSRHGTADADWTRFVVAEATLALRYLHTHGVIHGDVKPENLMLTTEGHVKLGDFGSATSIADASAIQLDGSESGIDGTAEYLAPEILAGAVRTPACDWWSLGCVMYQMLVGHVPFHNDKREQLFEQIRSQDVPFPDEVPLEARQLIMRFLERNAESRLNPDTEHGFQELRNSAFFQGLLDWEHINESPAPQVQTGTIAASKISMKLRQRRYSMLLTNALPQKYQYQTVSLQVIPEEDPDELLG